ncbi:hypothetical protein OAS97_11205, partial [Pseudomonadales bacterium]|nr:hypothetical protein [Pseudomonadales bacterium]
PENAGTMPEPEPQKVAGQILAGLPAQEFVSKIKDVSTVLWSEDPSGHLSSSTLSANPQELETALDEGSALLADMNHYSGGTFHYGGEWYWGGWIACSTWNKDFVTLTYVIPRLSPILYRGLLMI